MPNKFGDFYWIMIGWFIMLSVQIFQLLFVIYRRVIFCFNIGDVHKFRQLFYFFRFQNRSIEDKKTEIYMFENLYPNILDWALRLTKFICSPAFLSRNKDDIILRKSRENNTIFYILYIGLDIRLTDWSSIFREAGYWFNVIDYYY